MNLLSLIIAIVLVGVLLWAVNKFIPMDGAVKRILNVVVIIALIVWLLYAFGVMGHIENIKVGMVSLI